MEDTLLVTEIFYSVQGEGRSMGRPSYFLRLFGCHFTCSWCDSKHSWAPEYRHLAKKMTKDEIVNQIAPGSNVIITGGEPLLWQDKAVWMDLLDSLDERECRIEIETSGYHMPSFTSLGFVSQWNISPKLPSAGANESAQENVQRLINFIGAIKSGASYDADWQLKFVVSDETDWRQLIDYIEQIRPLEAIKKVDLAEHIYVMPQCKTTSEHIVKQEWLVEKVKEYGKVIYSPRLHVLVWSDKKAV